MVLPNYRIYLSESSLHIGASLSEAIKIYLLHLNISLPESKLGDIYLYKKLPGGCLIYTRDDLYIVFSFTIDTCLYVLELNSLRSN